MARMRQQALTQLGRSPWSAAKPGLAHRQQWGNRDVLPLEHTPRKGPKQSEVITDLWLLGLQHLPPASARRRWLPILRGLLRTLWGPPQRADRPLLQQARLGL